MIVNLIHENLIKFLFCDRFLWLAQRLDDGHPRQILRTPRLRIRGRTLVLPVQPPFPANKDDINVVVVVLSFKDDIY